MTSGLLTDEPQYDNSIFANNMNREIFNYETTRGRRKRYCCRFGSFVFIVGTNILSFYLGNKLNYKLNW